MVLETLVGLVTDEVERMFQQMGGSEPLLIERSVAPPEDIHRVCNTADTVAITLHVYGADLSKGTSVRRTYRQRPEHTDS